MLKATIIQMPFPNPFVSMRIFEFSGAQWSEQPAPGPCLLWCDSVCRWRGVLLPQDRPGLLQPILQGNVCRRSGREQTGQGKNKSPPWRVLCRNHFVHAPNHWETTLHCNVVSHWLGACTKWSLLWWLLHLIIIIKSEIWPICHCLGLGHETMVHAVCLCIFLWC